MASSMKTSATKDSSNREASLVRLFNGAELSDEEYGYFSCPREALNALRVNANGSMSDSDTKAKVIGGLNKHYDFTVGDVRGELKHSATKTTGAAALQWQPWLDGVQFLQGQTKSKEALNFMGDCGPALWSAWYEQEVAPFASVEVPAPNAFEVNTQLWKEHNEILKEYGKLRNRLTELWANPILPK